MSLNHPVFLASGIGQTAERVWLDLAESPDSQAAEVAARLGVNPKTVRRALDKLSTHGLVESHESATGRPGRPSQAYRLAAASPGLDGVAERLGVADWYERTADRYDRERAGYAEFRRQRTRSLSSHNTQEQSHT